MELFLNKKILSVGFSWRVYSFKPMLQDALVYNI